MKSSMFGQVAALLSAVAILLLSNTVQAFGPASAYAASAATPTTGEVYSETQNSVPEKSAPLIVCKSEAGKREYCPADTSAGVLLARNTGTAECLLGKTWGYDDTGIWVSDGCGGTFAVGSIVRETVGPALAVPETPPAPH